MCLVTPSVKAFAAVLLEMGKAFSYTECLNQRFFGFFWWW